MKKKKKKKNKSIENALWAYAKETVFEKPAVAMGENVRTNK